MLIQHLLTERLMRNLFQNPEFTTRNVIAAQVQNVIKELASASFSTAEFLKRLDPYYKAIEKAGANLSHFTEKQDFLNSVYEQFFQKFSPDIPESWRKSEKLHFLSNGNIAWQMLTALYPGASYHCKTGARYPPQLSGSERVVLRLPGPRRSRSSTGVVVCRRASRRSNRNPGLRVVDGRRTPQ
jgi:hypothetical protein